MTGPRRTHSETATVPSGVLASFAEPQFRWLLTSNTSFFMGIGGQQVLRAWLVFQLTKSELALGVMSAVVAVPMLVVAPLGGVVADRFDRRNLVALGQGTVVVGEAAILWLLLLDALEYWHLLVMAGVMGLVFPFIMPARQAIVANVVGRRRLTNAMALNMAAVNTTRVLGPAAAGLLIAVVGASFAYSVNVAFYLLALVCMSGVHAAPPQGEIVSTSMVRSLGDGLRYMGEQRLVLVLVFFGLVPMFLVMPFQSLLVVFTEKIWRVGPQGLGLLSAASGVGGVVGAVLVAWRSRSPQRLRAMLTSLCGFGVFLIGFASSPWYALALLLVFAASLCANFFSALNNTAIQVLIPNAVRGRVSSFLMMSFSLPLLGALPVSAAAEAYGVDRAVAASAILSMVVTLVFYLASASLRNMDRQVEEAMAEPH